MQAAAASFGEELSGESEEDTGAGREEELGGDGEAKGDEGEFAQPENVIGTGQLDAATIFIAHTF